MKKILLSILILTTIISCSSTPYVGYTRNEDPNYYYTDWYSLGFFSETYLRFIHLDKTYIQARMRIIEDDVVLSNNDCVVITLADDKDLYLNYSRDPVYFGFLNAGQMDNDFHEMFAEATISQFTNFSKVVIEYGKHTKNISISSSKSADILNGYKALIEEVNSK